MWKCKPKIKSRVFRYTIHRSSQEVKLSPPATSATDIEGKTSCVGGDQERRQEEKFRKSGEATEVIR